MLVVYLDPRLSTSFASNDGKPPAQRLWRQSKQTVEALIDHLGPGCGDGDQDDEEPEPVASSTSNLTSETPSMLVFRSIMSVLVRFVDASYFGQVAEAGVGGLVRWE